jgi:hypothetical protein
MIEYMHSSRENDALAEATFVLMNEPSGPNICLERAILRQPDALDQLPQEIFADVPLWTGDLSAGGLQTLALPRPKLQTAARNSRDLALRHILELTDDITGVAASPNLGGEIMRLSGLFLNRWGLASYDLIKYGCINTVKPAVKGRIVAIVVHPGAVEETVRRGGLSVPEAEQIAKLERISQQASRLATIAALAEALNS